MNSCHYFTSCSLPLTAAYVGSWQDDDRLWSRLTADHGLRRRVTCLLTTVYGTTRLENTNKGNVCTFRNWKFGVKKSREGNFTCVAEYIVGCLEKVCYIAVEFYAYLRRIREEKDSRMSTPVGQLSSMPTIATFGADIDVVILCYARNMDNDLHDHKKFISICMERLSWILDQV